MGLDFHCPHGSNESKPFEHDWITAETNHMKWEVLIDYIQKCLMLSSKHLKKKCCLMQMIYNTITEQ